MIFSVFNAESRQFDYYEGPEVGPSRAVIGPNKNLGTPADEAGVALPIGASKIGSGIEARGRIARSGINWGQVTKWGMIGLAAFGLYALVRGRSDT